MTGEVARGPRSLRLLHTSDHHLDGDAPRAERILDALVAGVRSADVDVVLVAGDLFDSNRVGDDLVVRTATAFAACRVPVIILPGNHDCYDETSVYLRFVDAAAPNVRILREDGMITLGREGLAVWGRPVVVHAPAFLPLDGLPARAGARWHVAVAHGDVRSDADERFRFPSSSPIFPSQLRDAAWDFLALGHWHVRSEVTAGAAPAWYSGAPTDSSPGLVVTLDPQRGAVID